MINPFYPKLRPATALRGSGSTGQAGAVRLYRGLRCLPERTVVIPLHCVVLYYILSPSHFSQENI